MSDQPPQSGHPLQDGLFLWTLKDGVRLRTFGDEELALAYDERMARTHLIDALALEVLQLLGMRSMNGRQLLAELLGPDPRWPSGEPMGDDSPDVDLVEEQRLTDVLASLSDIGLISRQSAA